MYTVLSSKQKSTTMEKPDIVYNQCRFCLKVIEQFSSYSIFSGDPQPSSLYVFVQRMLSLQFTAENSYVCGDCFSVWQMIQDYVHACYCANQILRLSTELTVRTPWLDGIEENQMLLGVCRRVKKLCHEMEILLKTVQHPPKRRRRRRRRSEIFAEIARQSETAKMNGANNGGHGVKQEDEVEIDDSEAFQTNDPIEARRKDSDVRMSEVRISSELEEMEDPLGNANESIDDSVTIIEANVDHIDLVDSSSEGEELAGDGADEEEELDYSEDSLPSWQKKEVDIQVLKTVCQVCGATTNDMANHLESHIREPPKKPPAIKVQTESDSSTSSSSLKPKKKRDAAIPPPSAQQPLKCNVCGLEFTNLLAAKLHARSHPLNRTIPSSSSTRTHGSGKSRPMQRKNFR